MALAVSGDVYAGTQGKTSYQLISWTFVALTALFFALSSGRTSAVSGRRLVLLTAMLALAGAMAWTADSLIVNLRPELEQIDAFIADPIGSLFRPQSVGFPDGAELGTVAYRKGNEERRVALRIVSKTAPGYVRGRAFVDYAPPNWVFQTEAEPLHPSLAPPDGVQPASDRTFELWPGRAPWQAAEIHPSQAFPVSFTLAGTSCVSADVPSLYVDLNAVVKGNGLLPYTVYASATPPAGMPATPDPDRYTGVPSTLDPRVHQLAKSVFAGRTTVAEKANAVEAYFHGNYTYNLGITIPSGVDPLTYFLLERPAAHCEYFAAGAAILLRLGDVQCRYATGFMVSERNGYGGYWVARNRDAHAWVEAFDPSRGWFIVEATPSSGLPESHAESVPGSRWDALKFRLLQLRIEILQNGLRGAWQWILSLLSSLGASMWLLPPALLVALVLWLRRVKLGRRKRKSVQSRPLDARVLRLQNILKEVDRAVAKRGFRRGETETLHHFAARLDASAGMDGGLVEFAGWYRRYAVNRYGVSPQNGEQLQPPAWK